MSGRLRPVALFWSALLLAWPPLLPAQELRTAVVPADITVGDVFHVVIRASGTGDAQVLFPDTLALPADLEAAGRRVLRRDTIGGQPGWTALYPVTAWRTGGHTVEAAPVEFADGATSARAAAVFPTVRVRSVLPADTAGVTPKPARDVLGANRVWWPILLALLLLLAALAALAVWYRRRRRAHAARPLPLEPALPPRTLALQALDAALASGALERGEHKRFYTAVSDALREYVASFDGRLGRELTTTELLQRLRGLERDAGAADLRAALLGADLVKFARRRPERQTALDEWQRARRWVEQYEAAGPAVERAA